MVAVPSERAKFTASVVSFIQTYGFDGLDFDWEYPANRGGVPADKVGKMRKFKKNVMQFPKIQFDRKTL